MPVCDQRHRDPHHRTVCEDRRRAGRAAAAGRLLALSDSELVCLAVAQALLGFTSEAQWLHARKHLAGMFPYLPQQSGYNKRLRAGLGLVKR